MIKKIFSLNIIMLSVLVFSSCEKEVSVSGPTEFEIGNTSYAISTYPHGAAIFVDGKSTGKFSPDTVNYLTSEMHTFTLKLAPFIDYTFSDSTVVDEILTKEYDFFSDMSTFGTLILDSNPPGCAIYLNDIKLAQQTPEVLSNIPPGIHKIKFTFPEHRSDSTEVYLLGGKALRVKLELSDTSVWVTYNKKNSYLTDNTIRDILFDNTNTMWIATSENGIIKNSSSKKTFFNTSNSNLPSNKISRLREDLSGNIWACTFNGLAKIEGNQITSYTTDNSDISGNLISDVAFENNIIWVGTDKGLNKFDGSTWKVYNISNSGISGNFITSICLVGDKIWIGTNQFDVTMFDKNDTFRKYESDDSNIGNSVSDIIQYEGKIIFGMANRYPNPGILKPGGLFYFKNLEENLQKYNPTLRAITVNSFYLDDVNTLWIATEGGAFEIKQNQNYEVYDDKIKELPTKNITAISKDKSGNMWFGTKGSGLVKYKIWKN